MTKKFIVLMGIFFTLLLGAEYFILGNSILSNVGEVSQKSQSKQEFCSKYPRHRACF